MTFFFKGWMEYFVSNFEDVPRSEEDMQSSGKVTIKQKQQNQYLSLSESVTACVAHPLNATIVAGTKVLHISVS